MLLGDVITAGVQIVNKLIELHKLDEWAKLIFGFVFTFITTYSVACGTSLVTGHNLLVSTGSGLLAGAGSITALFYFNPRTKGIMIVQDKANLPDMSNYQAVEKNK